MSAFDVVFHREAQVEAIEAARYIAEHGSKSIAERWLADLEIALDSLTKWPRRFSFARENDSFPDAELRQINHYSHRIIFMIDDTTVHVLHVRHMARDGIA